MQADELRAQVRLMRGLVNSRDRCYQPQQMEMEKFQHATPQQMEMEMFQRPGVSASGLVGSSSNNNNNLLDNSFGDAGEMPMPFHSRPAPPYPFELQQQSIYDMVPSNPSHFPHVG